MAKNNKKNILMELRPALEGFAGIPQVPNVEVTGLVNHYRIKLSPALSRENQWSSDRLKHKRINKLSRHIVSYTEKPYLNWFEKIINLQNRAFSQGQDGIERKNLFI